MSTSKGRGAAAHEIVEVIPPEQLRFFFLRPKPNHAVDFDPVGTDAVPRLFDEFDKFADATAGRPVRGDLPPGYAGTFAYSLLDPRADVAAEAAAFRPAFGHLALLAQIPNADIRTRIDAEKGSDLTTREEAILDERVRAARAWLEAYAPERAIVAVREDPPIEALLALDDDQRGYLGALAEAGPAPVSGEGWQDRIFSVATDRGLANGRAFAAIYAAFLGRTNGPRAGWLLASLDPEFVVERLRVASGQVPA
jgi:lysyl-tRNA synthetase class 1